MAVHIAMFRIKYDSTYQERWDSIVEVIRQEAGTGPRFEGMTSSIFLQSSKSANDLVSRIYLHSKMNAEKDELVVVDVTNTNFATRGKIDELYKLQSVFGGYDVLSAVLSRLGN